MFEAQRKFSRGLATVVALVALFLGAETAPGQSVVINEVFTGNPDYVEITNFATSAVDLSNWTIHSSFGFSVYPHLTLPAGTIIPAGASLLLLELNASLPPSFAPPEPSTIVINTGFSWGWVGNSSGCVALVDPTGFGHDFVVFGTMPCTLPGGGSGAVFNGVLDRGNNDPGSDNVIQRTSSLDTDNASDWSMGPDVLATPGALNPTQGFGAIDVQRLVLDGDGALMNLHADGTFDVTGTIAAVVTSQGATIDNPLWDTVIGGTMSFSGNYSVNTNTPSGSYEGMTFAPASFGIVSTAPGTDSLALLNLFQVQGAIEAELGGTYGSTPRTFRRVSSLGPNAPQRNGQNSQVLTGLQANLPTSTLDFDIEITAAGPRVLSFGRNLPTRPATWDAHFAAAAPGQIEVGVINGGGGELYHLFVVNPAYAIGTGPVAGIDFGPLQFEMAISPLGTHPFHVAPLANGTYHFISAPGLIPIGWTLDFLAVRLQNGVLETLPPQRAQF